MSSQTDALFDWMVLSFVQGIGSANARQLVAFFGSPKEVLMQSKEQLIRVPGIGSITAKQFNTDDAFRKAELEMKFIEKYKIDCHLFLDEDYPFRLKQCDDAPILIFSKGSQTPTHRATISIVGTRLPSEYGKHHCKRIISELKDSGINPIIVSGLAHGIDACAHKSALELGLTTIGVLAHGLDRIYPVNNKALAMELLHNGRLITEFPHGVFPAAGNFISRNRIIAGLSDLTIVVESKAKGGSLVTADFAFGYNREVMAFPGRIGDERSEGCNNLIKYNKAGLLSTVDDLVRQMNWDLKLKTKQAKQLDLFSQLTDTAKQLLDWLRAHPDSTIDEITKNSGIQPKEVPATLLDLEFGHLVKVLPGKIYRVF